MELINSILANIESYLWMPVMLVLLLGTGLYLTIRLNGIPIRRLGYGFQQLMAGRRETDDAGEITPFQALSTSLSATIGTGNIAGVATAIALGGPGAVFWMWITALVGMATKYSEAVLAVKYREVDERGAYVGGPMYYIRKGMGQQWAWMGAAFAFVGMFAALGIGNAVQSNSVADVLSSELGIADWITGAVLTVLVLSVTLGGLKRIARVAERLVPFMAVLYVVIALAVILINIGSVPAALGTIVSDAFTGTAATGGFAGVGIIATIQFGVARGIFSNEAGIGSAPMAHAAARTNDPVRQGSVAMLSPLIDTIIVCTMTALVIVLTGTWTTGESSSALSAAAFGNGLSGGQWIVTLATVVFAFTTTLTWSYYGERCAEYLFGVSIITPYRWFWGVILFGGALVKVDLVWHIAGIMNGLMALPNLIALLALSGTVVAVTREYFGGGSNTSGEG